MGEETMVSLSLSDGLTGETVNRIMTDHSGTTWIATNSGVNAYNGKQLHAFQMKGEGGQPLEVNDLCEISGHHIYAATSSGLWRMSYGVDNFEQVLPEITQASCLYAVGDSLFIGGQQGLMVYDGKQLKHVNVGVSHQGLDNIVRQFLCDEDGQIWFLGRYDLNNYNPQTGKISRYDLHLPDMKSPLAQFACIGKRRFVIGTHGNGLFDCDIQAGTATAVKGVGNLVMSVQRSADGYVCVSTDGSGAYLMALRDNQLEVCEHYSMEAAPANRLPSNGVYCYYRDVHHVNWFGFVRYGLTYTYHCGSLFKPFRVGDFTTEGINVRTVCHHDNDFVIGTQNGFYYVNRRSGQWRYYSSDDLGGGHIVNTICWYEDSFYIGTFDGGLHTFNPHAMKVERQSLSPLLDDASIGDLKTDMDNRLWIGSIHGLMIVKDGQIQQHFTEQNSPIISGLILSITFDNQNNAWLTGKTGCSLYSGRSHEIVKANYPKGFFNHLPWMKGTSGHDGMVFFRTGPQTFYTNVPMTDYGELRLPVKFSDKWCRSFVDDRQGHYVLGSERGVFSFDYTLKELRQFGYGEGLRGDFINDVFMDGGRNLWVATSQGLYYAEYQNFFQWDAATPFKTYLLNIRRGSTLMNNMEEYISNEEKSIRLSWNITTEVLQAEPLLMDYSQHKGRLFEYRIDGGEWQFVTDGQSLLVEGLQLGQHQLSVRQAGCSGSTSVFSITVLPSVGAIVELILLVTAIVLLWLWWRSHKYTKAVIKEHRLTEEALMEETAELREKTEKDAESDKYHRVKISDEECEDIVRRMRRYLESEHAYRNPDLKRTDISEAVGVSAVKLSQVFTLYLKENYYDFINRYRLDEFKKLVEEGECQKYTVTAISERCGFKKSSFFTTFRKVEGMTPTEYLSKKKIKVS